MKIQDCLQSIAECSAALELILIDEGELVVNGPDHELLHEFAEKKTELSQKINDLALWRKRYLAEQNLEDPGLPEDIEHCLQRCQKLNQQAGASINTQLRYTKRALEVLGMGDDNPVYNARGDSHSTASTHAIAKA